MLWRQHDVMNNEVEYFLLLSDYQNQFHWRQNRVIVLKKRYRVESYYLPCGRLKKQTKLGVIVNVGVKCLFIPLLTY